MRANWQTVCGGGGAPPGTLFVSELTANIFSNSSPSFLPTSRALFTEVFPTPFHLLQRGGQAAWLCTKHPGRAPCAATDPRGALPRGLTPAFVPKQKPVPLAGAKTLSVGF